MAGDYEDLYQEAAIATVKALITAQKKESPERFIPFFRVIFKTRCIKLASGIQTVHCLEDYLLPCPDEYEDEIKEPEAIEIEQALMVVSKRQREICHWLLQQSTPASTPDIAREFNVSRRHACRLVSESIQRIEGAAP
jgi:RNA polymerase sigma factor (sigma-70 family)